MLSTSGVDEERIRSLALRFCSRSDLFHEISKLERMLLDAAKAKKYLLQLKHLSRLDKHSPLSQLNSELRRLEEKLSSAKTDEDKLSLTREIGHLTKLYERERDALKRTSASGSLRAGSQISTREESTNQHRATLETSHPIQVGKPVSSGNKSETIVLHDQTSLSAQSVVQQNAVAEVGKQQVLLKALGVDQESDPGVEEVKEKVQSERKRSVKASYVLEFEEFIPNAKLARKKR